MNLQTRPSDSVAHARALQGRENAVPLLSLSKGSNKFQCLGTAALLVSLSAFASGQSASPTASTAASEEETITLSPFSVQASGDVGYKSRNAVSATRLNKPLVETPMPIEVITHEFIDDVGATNLRDALRYSAGVVLRSQNDAYSSSANGANNSIATSLGGGTSSLNAQNRQGVTANFGGATYKIRGFVTPSTLRDGFTKRTQTDAIGVDRVEVVRGPSALLYGIGSFGGIVNDLPKRPLFVTRNYVEAGVGDRDYLRAAFDSTGPLVDKKLAYRVMGAAQQNDVDQTGIGKATTRFLEPVITYRPYDGTQILADLELMNYKETGNGFQVVHQIFTPNASDIPAAFPLDGSALTYDSNGKAVPAASRIEPRTAKLSGPDTYAKTDNYNLQLDLEQKLGTHLFFKAGINLYHADNGLQQVGAQLQTQTVGLSNRVNVKPDDWGKFSSLAQTITERWRAPILARNGFIYTDKSLLAYEWQRNESEDKSLQSRFELHGTWEFLGGKQSILVGRTDTKRDTLTHVWQETDFNYRSPSDFAPLRFGETQKDPAKTPQTPLTKQPGSEDFAWEQGTYGVLNSSLFSDRVNIIAGIRHDRADARTNNLSATDALASVSDRSAYAAKAPSQNSKQLGLSVKVLEGLYLFGDYSEGLIPNYGVTNGNNQPFAPTTAKSKEIGLKFDLLDGKISGTVAAFKITRQNTPRLIWWAPQERLPGQVGYYDPSKPTVMLGYLPSAFLATNPSALPAILADTFTVNGTQQTGAQLLASQGGYYMKLPQLAGSTYDPSSPGYQLLSNFFDWMRTTREINDIGWVFNTSGQDGVKLVNAPGMYSGGTYVPMNDESKGIDTQIVFSPTKNLQMVATYAYTVRSQTVGFKYVDTPYYNPFSMWYFPELFWGTMDFRTAANAYVDPKKPSTFKNIPSLSGQGRGLDDQAKHSASIWSKYTFDSGPLNRFGIGFGYSYTSSQEYYSGYAPDGNAILFKNGASASDVVSLRTKPQQNVDLELVYKIHLKKYQNWTVRLNVYNLFDDRALYGSLWAPGRSVRLTNSLSF